MPTWNLDYTNGVGEPAGHALPRLPYWSQMAYPDEPLTFELGINQGNGAVRPEPWLPAATTYTVRDYYGAAVQTGMVTGRTLTLAPLPVGWYKLYLERPEPVDSHWRTSGGEAMFCVVRRNLELPARVAAESSFGPDPLGEGVDYPTRGFTRFGPWRKSVDAHSENFTSQLSGALSAVEYENEQWGDPDPVRPLYQFGNIPHAPTIEGVVTNPALTHPTQIGDYVSGMVAAGATVIEGFNEPNNFNYSNRSPAGFAQWTADLRAVAKAAAPSVQIAGPCSINITNQLSWMRDCLVAAGDDLDVVSFHAYNAVNGDLAAGRRNYAALRQMLADIGMAHKPLLNSEGGSYFATNYGSFEPRLQAQRAMLEFHLCEQFDLPKERFCYFYDRSHGFWNYASFWLAAQGNMTFPMPLAAIMRVWSEELRGKAKEEVLDFGTVENDHFIGTRFENPSTGESVVALQGAGRAGQVRFSLTGTDVVTLVGTFGEESVCACAQDGSVLIDVGLEPSYVRLPAGARLTPEAVDYGVNIGWGQRATPSASHPAATISGRNHALSAVANGKRDNWYMPNAGYEFLSEHFAEGDGWVQVAFSRPSRFDTVIIDSTEPWQEGGSYLDFDVQYTTDPTPGPSSTWTTIATREVPYEWVEWTSQKHVGACFSDQFWSREHLFVVSLDEPVTASAVRLYARGISWGGTVNRGAQTGGSVGATCYTGGPRKLSMRELGVYLSSPRGTGSTTGRSVLGR